MPELSTKKEPGTPAYSLQAVPSCHPKKGRAPAGAVGSCRPKKRASCQSSSGSTCLSNCSGQPKHHLDGGETQHRATAFAGSKSFLDGKSRGKTHASRWEVFASFGSKKGTAPGEGSSAARQGLSGATSGEGFEDGAAALLSVTPQWAASWASALNSAGSSRRVFFCRSRLCSGIVGPDRAALPAPMSATKALTSPCSPVSICLTSAGMKTHLSPRGDGGWETSRVDEHTQLHARRGHGGQFGQTGG